MTVVKQINAEWHKANVMPRNATVDQRIAWHQEHVHVCGCRPIPDRLKAEIEKRAEQR